MSARGQSPSPPSSGSGKKATPPPAHSSFAYSLGAPTPAAITAWRLLLRHAPRFDRRDGRVQGSLARDAQRHVKIFLRAVLGLPQHHRQAQHAVIAELQTLAGLHRESIAIGRGHVALRLRAHRRLDDLIEVELAGELALGVEGAQFEGGGRKLRLVDAHGHAAVARPGDFLELVLAAAVAVRPKSGEALAQDGAVLEPPQQQLDLRVLVGPLGWFG